MSGKSRSKSGAGGVGLLDGDTQFGGEGGVGGGGRGGCGGAGRAGIYSISY